MANMNSLVNMRLDVKDAEVLKAEAEERRMPFSAYCRYKLTKDIKHN
tara:strand:+ start:585 stop:725 length:141 start_codon:yes stop_codon:yes gene_type:complete